MIPDEKKMAEEVIRMYKAHPVLWNKKHPHYMKREVREEAYSDMLKKFKTLYKDATIKELRKKIENLRSGHRKESRKVAQSVARGDNPVYTPKVWYFDRFSFLKYDDIPYDATSSFDMSNYEEYEDNEEDDTHKPMRSFAYSDSDDQFEMTEEYIEDNEDSDHSSEDPKERRLKKRKLSSVPDEVNKKQKRVTKTNDQESRITKEWMAFGLAVGLQLQSLDGIQRMIAEKLISEVIFYARLNKLSTHSYLKLEDD